MQNSGVLNNLAGATFEIGDNKEFNNNNIGTGTGPRINNAGTIRKVGSGTMYFRSGVAFHNTNTIEVDGGTLQFDGSVTHEGSIELASGTTLTFQAGTHTFTSQSNISGEGAVQFKGATVTIGGTYDIGTTSFTAGTATFNTTVTSENTTFTGGTLAGTGNFTATGPFTWTGGTMAGTGVTTISDTLTLNAGNWGGVTLGRTLNNAGTIVWTNTTTVPAYLWMQNGAVLNNLAGATFEVGDNKEFTYNNIGAGSLPIVNNADTLRKVGGGDKHS
jgi:fibronectin-binding autotransporter adhesin